MKIKISSIALSIFWSTLSAFADAPPYVVKKNGDTVWSENEIDQSIFKFKRFVKAGNDTIDIDEVAELKNKNGKFKESPPGSKIFGLAKMEQSKGNIDRYSISGYPSFLIFQSKFYSTEIFYSVNNSPLRSIEYENVLYDFGKYDESRKYLRIYNNLERSDHWLMAGGLGMMAFGGYLLSTNSPKLIGQTLASIGSCSLFGGFMMWTVKDKYLLEAVDSFFHVKEKSKD